MAELAATINWQDVEKGAARIVEYHVSRFRAIGKFLKTNELAEVLTWEAIEQVLPPLSKKNRRTTKLIRSSLFDLGHLFAERGLLLEWNSHMANRRIRQAMQSAPVPFLDHVQRFKKWAEEGMLNPKMPFLPMDLEVLSCTSKTIFDTVTSISSFLNWCERRGAVSLDKIDGEVVADYQRSVCWQYECKVCHRRFPFEDGESIERCANPECGVKHSYAKTMRISRRYLAWQTSHLRSFFNWAELHGFVTANPLAGETCRIVSKTVTHVDERGRKTRIGDAIRRYDDSVILRLCGYIVSPDADPEEALILYLIIFHLCTVKELCNLRIPSQVSRGKLEAQVSLEHDYEYLLFSPSAITRGCPRPRRSELKLVFPRKARPWLAPLLRRFYEKRKSLVSTERYEYLLSVKGRRRHNWPASEMYVRRIVRRASLRVLKTGEVCSSRLLSTAAALFAQKSRRRSAVLTKMGYHGPYSTRFNYLETVILPLKITIQTNDRRM